MEIIWDYTSWGYCKLEHIKHLEQCEAHGKHVNNILFATTEYVLQATVHNCSGSKPELNQIKVRASSPVFLMRLVHVELCMELFYGKTSTLDIMQVVTIYYIDIFTKYYKVKYHANSPYYTGLHTGKTKYGKTFTSVFGIRNLHRFAALKFPI